MTVMTRGGALIACTAVMVGVSAGVAQAAAPHPAPAPAPLQQVDQNAYNAAIASQSGQVVGSDVAATLAGMAGGCVVGGAAGLIVLPAAILTVPVGCAVGATIGGIVSGTAVGNAVFQQTEPGVMQACLTAMPKVACQIVENDRIHSASNF